MLSAPVSVSDIEISDTMRRYLAEIYHLSQTKTRINPTMLAARTKVTTPATARMVRRLAKRGLVEYEPYNGIYLSADGRRIVLFDLRCLRLIACFLVDNLGFSWYEAHSIADQMSKGLPPDVVKRIEAVLDYPQHCPYGEPIPTEEGEMFTLDDKPLTALAVGATGSISRVKTRDPEQLRYLAELGLTPGTAFELINQLPFNGPVQLKLDYVEPVIGFELAASLWANCSTC